MKFLDKRVLRLVLICSLLMTSQNIYSQWYGKEFEDVYKVESEKQLNGLVLEGEVEIDFNSDGDLYVLDAKQGLITVYDQDMQLKFTFGGKGNEPGKFEKASDIHIDDNDQVYISDPYLERVSIFSKNGVFKRSVAILNQAVDLIIVNEMLCTHTGGAIAKDGNSVQCYDVNTGKPAHTLFKKSKVIENVPFGFSNISFAVIQKSENKIIILKHPFDPAIQVFNDEGVLVNEFRINNEIYSVPKFPEKFDVFRHLPTMYAKYLAHGFYVFQDRIVIIFVDTKTGKKYMDVYNLGGERQIEKVIHIQNRFPIYGDKNGSLYAIQYASKDKKKVNLKKYSLHKMP
ncbi:MAG: hypothetical protein FH748_02310 [Balneolaceae bacterium]|nr:hypothetical protein [Balneolaceae bacterium]